MTFFFSRAPFVLCLLISILHLSTAVAASDQFEQGKKYFNDQKYRSAAESFQKLIDSGDRRAVVYYNLGVSEYKLNQYSRAEQHFTAILDTREFSDLARYNIGLINAKLEKLDLAKIWFNKIKKNNNKELYERARKMINKIEYSTRTTSESRQFSGLLAFTLGSDDNVNRVTDNSPTNIRDNFYITYVSGSIPIKNNPIFLGVSHYAVKYSDLTTNDFSIIRAEVGHKTKLDKWKIKSIFSYASSDLGGNSYQNSLRLNIKARLRLTEKSLLKISYKYDDIEAPDILNTHLDGWRQQIRLNYKTRISDFKIDTRYKLELNDRTDTLTESFSPTRHTLRGIAMTPITNMWTLGADIAYRTSDYPAVSGGAGRTEDRLLAALLVRYKINNNWFIESKIQTSSNDSDNPTFNYNRNELLLNTSYIF